jgi:hypothetical protein
MRVVTSSLLALAAALALTGCAGTNPSNPTPSTQAPSSVVSAAANAMLNSFTSSFNAGNSKAGYSRLGAGDVISRPRFQVFVQPPDERNACPSGGYVSTSATLSGTLSDQTGQGNLSWQSYQSFVDCSFDGGWLLESNGANSFGGTIGEFGNHETINVTVGGNGGLSLNGVLVGTYYFTGVLLQWDNFTGWSNSGSFCTTPGPVCVHM